MGLDASIYNLIQQPKAMPGPLEQFGQVMQLRHLLDQSQLSGLQRQELERSIAEEGKIRDLFAQNPNATPEAIAAISPKRGFEYGKLKLDREKSAAELEKTRAETMAKNIGIMRDTIAQASSDADMPVVREMAFRLFGEQGAARIPQKFDAAWQREKIMDASKRLEALTPKLARVTMPDGSIKTIDENTRTNPQAANFSAPAAMTPAQAAQLNKPVWDAERAVWVTPPPVGQPRAPFAAAASAGPTAPAASPAAPQAAPQPSPQPAPLLPKAEMDRVAKEKEKAVETAKTLNQYVAARDGLLNGLGRASTGPVVGMLPAMSTDAQIAEGGVAAMAPVLKQLFRAAGEGTFTDKDQELLLAMVPTRKDSPEARAEKMANIDRIVAAKLGMAVPPPKLRRPKEADKGGKRGIKFLGFE